MKYFEVVEPVKLVIHSKAPWGVPPSFPVTLTKAKVFWDIQNGAIPKFAIGGTPQ